MRWIKKAAKAAKKAKRTEQRVSQTAEKVHHQHQLTKRHLKKYDTAKIKKAAKKKTVQKKVRAQLVANT
ncbi:MAG: hypothetical protein Q9N67_00985 [Ghiorsea sp.]|nr:hypothetical protein [Ghiorsea sp.]